MLAVWGGLALDGSVTPQDELQPFIDSALEEIEFVRGSIDTTWGARRAELGHPEPFNLEYVEISNEDWLAGYPEGLESYRQYRFPMFRDAINAAYPDIQVISSCSQFDNYSFPEGAIGDYHPYREPDDLVEEFDRFDNARGHIVGEVAATFPNNGTEFDGPLSDFPFWIGAIGEAVSLIGYERNADRIDGAMYAPILRNMNRWQWPVTMVHHAADPALTTKSVSWYIWEALAASPMSHTLPASENFGPVFYVAGKDEYRDDARIWKGACYNISSNDIYNTSASGNSVPVSVAFDGVKAGTKANLKQVTNPGGDPYAMVDPLQGNEVVQVTETVITANSAGAFEFEMVELSMAVLDTDMEKDQPGRRRGHGHHGRGRKFSGRPGKGHGKGWGRPGKPPGFRP